MIRKMLLYRYHSIYNSVLIMTTSAHLLDVSSIVVHAHVTDKQHSTVFDVPRKRAVHCTQDQKVNIAN